MPADKNLRTKPNLVLVPALALALTAACGDDGDPSARMVPFALRFAATDGDRTVGCADTVTGLGPGETDSIGISDLRFYVSDVRFFDRAGEELPSTLDVDEFQLTRSAGTVALIDLTDTAAGSCADSAIAFAEGTARTHAALTGMVLDAVDTVTFDVGLPQALMKDVIANRTTEDAPSPLAEMYWSWAAGYRHFVFNFTVTDGAGTGGDGYVHVGSRDCGGDGARALTDREACGLINTPAVSLAGFDVHRDVVSVDLRELVAGIDFVAPVRDGEPPHEVIGQGPGVACHSNGTQDDCPVVFDNLGLDIASGDADAAANRVFGVL